MISTSTKAPGKILTFYSYKGGTGRSMALANIAWILATNGLRVLVIDWDLEAPGLHRYFHPFLDDKELTESTGLIDYFVDFTTQACTSHDAPIRDQEVWYERYTDLTGYISALDWEFANNGRIDFVPAGRQGPAYGARVTTFDWQEFYTKLGGGVLLETVKSWMREEYDYVLIDSRTGISDTSGICTVQMPDDLVVCYTLNRQSMQGAAAAARSAFEQRRKPNGEPGLRVWPLATRIELGESERLAAARLASRQLFQAFVGHIQRKERDYYWGKMEVQYQPYYAYEEVLAAFKDLRKQTKTLLADLESVTRMILGNTMELGPMAEDKRLEGFAKFVGEQVQPNTLSAHLPRVFFNYAAEDGEIAKAMAAEFTKIFGPAAILGSTEPGKLTFLDADSIVSIFGPGRKGNPESWVNTEFQILLTLNRQVTPVVVGKADPEMVYHFKNPIPPLVIPNPSTGGYWPVISAVQSGRTTQKPVALTVTDDPQKGKWGGLCTQNGRSLTASVRTVTDDWFAITLTVTSVSPLPLAGALTFYLHPSFDVPAITVEPDNGIAKLELDAWGAFTVGVVADHGRTVLELDLATLPDAPRKFCER